MEQEKKYYLFEIKGNLLQIISIVILALMILLTYLIGSDLKISTDDFVIAFILMYPYLILHELLHSLSYVIHGAKFKNITYGAHLEKGILCCLCKQNITKKNILITLLYPFIFIGVITYIIGMLTNNMLLIILSIFNISGCAGDLMMFLGLSKLKNFEFSEYDNPMAFGLYTNQDLSQVKMLGLKYIESVNELEKKDFKKITVSKDSIIMFIMYIVIGILYFIVI